MKVVILKNTTIDLTQDCIEAVEFFKKHNIDLEFTFKSVSIPTAIKPYKTFQGFNPVTGEPQTVHYYGLVNPGVLDPNYDMTVLLWDMDSVAKPTDGAITSFTTDHIQLAVNQWLKNNGKTTNMLTHEIMHNLCVIARSKGFPVVDEMDMTKTGLAFYKNDRPDASDGNYALTFNNLLPFINSLKGTYKYFTQAEITKWKLKPELFTLLDDLRGKCGFPFIINSGLRTKEENDAL